MKNYTKQWFAYCQTYITNHDIAYYPSEVLTKCRYWNYHRPVILSAWSISKRRCRSSPICRCLLYLAEAFLGSSIFGTDIADKLWLSFRIKFCMGLRDTISGAVLDCESSDESSGEVQRGAAAASYVAHDCSWASSSSSSGNLALFIY